MSPNLLRPSFIVFHLALGAGLLIGSVQTFVHAMHASSPQHHVALIAGIEGLGALLFLLPRTLRPGAALLLTSILLAIALHLAQQEWRWDLVVYAAGVWFVAVHGSGWTRHPEPRPARA